MFLSVSFSRALNVGSRAGAAEGREGSEELRLESTPVPMAPRPLRCSPPSAVHSFRPACLAAAGLPQASPRTPGGFLYNIAGV